MHPSLISVMGPTASGKSDLAETLAEQLGAILVNADAFQIYRGMDIGTAKPDDRRRYKMIDIRNPDEQFGVGEFIQVVVPILNAAFEAGRNVILVGGTGLYIRALVEQYDDLASAPDPALRESINALPLEVALAALRQDAPEIAQAIDIQNPIRVRRALERIRSPKERIPIELPPFKKVKLAIVPNPKHSEEKIESRTRSMVQTGWVQEVEKLLAMGYTTDDPGFRAIGYRPLASYLRGEFGLEDAIATTIAETRRYAKRQRSWLRSEPNLTFLDPELDLLTQSMERIHTV